MTDIPNNSASQPTEKTPPKTGEKGAQRDDKGHFLPGHSVGSENHFTKENHPVSPGRPKTRRLTDALLKYIGKKAEDVPFVNKLCKSVGLDPAEAKVEDVFIAAGIFQSIKGKGEYFKQVYNRIEGAVPKHLTLGGDDPVTVYMAMMKDRTAPKPEGKDDEKRLSEDANAEPTGKDTGDKGSAVPEVSADVPVKGVEKSD